MKAIYNILKSMLLIAVLLMPIMIIVNSGNEVIAATDIINPNNYNPGSSAEVSDGDRIETIGSSIVGILQAIGVIISVIVLAVLGIKYMIGSVEERAEYKKTMLPYLIGTIMVFGISLVLGVIIDIATSLF